MAEKKRRVEIHFDEEEFAILEGLSNGTKSSLEQVVYDSVARAHFTEEAKKGHEAFCWILSQDPIDLYVEWKEMKEWLEKDWAWQITQSYDQCRESP